jgi:hypothetical protein
VLLAMIFIVGWVWPSAAPAPVKQASASVEVSNNSMMLRIHSARKWPDKIVFDTNIPTIVPPVVAATAPPAPPVVAASPEASALDARAEMKQPAPSPPKRVAKVHRRNVRPAASAWAYANPSPPQWSWSNNSSWSNSSPRNSPRWSWNW